MVLVRDNLTLALDKGRQYTEQQPRPAPVARYGWPGTARQRSR